MRTLILFFCFVGLAFSCIAPQKVSIPETKVETFQDRILNILQTDSTFIHSHSGLVVRDIDSGNEIFNHKGSMYFTPASNTKLLTFYTAYSVLGDRMNGLKYYENEDSLIIWGTGDPSFLNDNLVENNFISDFLKNTDKNIYLSFSNFNDERYGPGWSWDDYNYGYQCEKSGFPIYGNFVNFKKEDFNSQVEVYPPFFKNNLHPSLQDQQSIVMRNEYFNDFTYDFSKVSNYKAINRYLPFQANEATTTSLLSEHLGKKVVLINDNNHIAESKSIRTIEMDSLYRLMLQPSDNFVAEQLLLNCSSELFDTMNTKRIIDWSKSYLLSELPDKFQWVDGSGLSRYNLTTPNNMVFLLQLIYSKVPKEKLFELLPTGGESGTIRNLYAAEKPYIYAKTGSLRNNHSLSGYLVGDSGKIYIFSFMNSNFISSSADIKEGMSRILSILKENL